MVPVLQDAPLLPFTGLLVSDCIQLRVVLFADGFGLHMLFHSFQDNKIYALLGYRHDNSTAKHSQLARLLVCHSLVSQTLEEVSIRHARSVTTFTSSSSLLPAPSF